MHCTDGTGVLINQNRRQGHKKHDKSIGRVQTTAVHPRQRRFIKKLSPEPAEDESSMPDPEFDRLFVRCNRIRHLVSIFMHARTGTDLGFSFG